MPVTPDLIIKVGDEEYRFDPKKILNAEAIAIEKAVNLSWAQVTLGLNTGLMSAVTGVVWILRKRESPRLQFAEVVFEVGDVEIIDPDTDPRYAVEDTEDAEPPKEETVPAEPS